MNIELNEELNGRAQVFSYPMRFAPINGDGNNANHHRERKPEFAVEDVDWLRHPEWTPRFVRTIEVLRGAAGGFISPVPSFARRVVGHSFEEFIINLYMPETLLRNRSRHERRVYPDEAKRLPGTGLVEAFREFMLGLLRPQDGRFRTFHNAVTANSVVAIRRTMETSKDRELNRWLKVYMES